MYEFDAVVLYLEFPGGFPNMAQQCSSRVKVRSHIPTRLNHRVGSLSVGIWDQGLQQQLGPFVRLIRRVVKLEMLKINDLIVVSLEVQLGYGTPLTTQLDGCRPTDQSEKSTETYNLIRCY